jgi:hypothetical protein
MSIEQELIKATEFNVNKVYKKRQDYLAALARAVDALDQDIFDEFSNEAAKWFEEAVNAINDKEELPDFEEETVSSETDDGSKFDPETGELEDEVEEVEEAPKQKKVSGKSAKTGAPIKSAELEADIDDDAEAEEQEVLPAKKRAKGQPPKKLNYPPIKLRAIDGMTLDRYGTVSGSKNSIAISMLEKGCRMSDIKNSIGGTYYNLLQRLVKDGHYFEKSANGMMKIIHKDDGAKKAAKAKR